MRTHAGCTENHLARQPGKHDAVQVGVPLGFDVDFYGVTYSSVDISANGLIVFTSRSSAPEVPASGSFSELWVPALAPFHADVDNTSEASGAITYGHITLSGRRALCVRWNRVGYSDGHADRTNTFQALVVDRGGAGAGAADFEYNYARIERESGDDHSVGGQGLGGTTARVGLVNASGSTLSSSEIAGSGVAGAFLDSGPDGLVYRRGRTGVPGRQAYLFRGGRLNPCATPLPPEPTPKPTPTRG